VTPKHSILLASYHFPPDAAVGALRVAKLARILPEFGWAPHVLTVRDDLRREGLDEGRLEGLQDIPVLRTGELPRVFETLGRARFVFGSRSVGPNAAAIAAPIPAAAAGETLERWLARAFKSLFLFLPDDKKNWSLRAAASAVRLIRQRRIEWVLTSGPPFSTHIIGLVAKLLTGVKWVADFRDPWVDMLPERNPAMVSAASDRLESWMEWSVVTRADRILTTTERMRSAMTGRYSSLPPERFVCMPNSVDTDRIQPGDLRCKFEVFTITYTGSLYFHRTPEPLFEAVGQLLASDKASRESIRIKLVGQCREVNGRDTLRLAGSYGLDGVVEVIDRVPHCEAVRIMQRSHLLLLLAPERHRLVVPAKIFDYFGSGASIGRTGQDLRLLRIGRVDSGAC
jgi:glycosyltransferase involved in cell wall biosynthesis